ncbi:MAG: hypothetical protein U0768_13020 [Anaerolineae bacterium]
MLPADFVVYDPDGQITLVVETKSKLDTSRNWATQMRRNILAHGMLPNAPFLLLAMPNRLYLWKNSGTSPELVAPMYEVDATPFFRPYYERAQVSPENLSGQSFGLIVASWLNELLQDAGPANLSDDAHRFLEESGLLEALRGGSVAVATLG